MHKFVEVLDEYGVESVLCFGAAVLGWFDLVLPSWVCFEFGCLLVGYVLSLGAPELGVF